MATARTLIERSMRLIGALGSAEAMTGAEGADGLTALNSLLESWSTNRLHVYTLDEAVYSWPIGQASRTIGPGGNFDAARPVRINHAWQRADGVDYPIRVIDAKSYHGIPDKTTQSDIVRDLYYDADYPLATLYAFPVPSEAVNIYLATWEPLQSFASLDTAASMPPGYERAIVFNLALELAAEYDKDPRPYVVQAASASKRGIKAGNMSRARLVVETAAISHQGGGFDYRSGDFV